MHQPTPVRRPRVHRHLATLLVALLALSLAGCSLIGIHRKLQSEGTPAIGEILDSWETGMTVNDSPVVGLRLRVEAEGLPPWEAETRVLISILDVPKVQPGVVVCLRYDPADHQEIVLAECLDEES